ncbi:MAG TPA: hypothetical protein PK990_07605 [Salinivirgaceae bacterium]|mgnify:CR=1 FL=1|nr:hypothetical protein [Salinivirgaceae bacterium]
MERSIYFFIIILSLFIRPVFAQNNPEIYRAYITGDMARWKSVIDSLERTNPQSPTEIAELLNYQYGYIAWAIGNNKTTDAKKYLSEAQKTLERLEKKGFNPALVYAYKSAFLGFEIGLSPYKAPFIGPKSIEYARQSVKLDESNCFGYIQLGNIAYYTPSMFGGSKTEALLYYLEAKKLMEKKSSLIKNNWNYLNLLSTLIISYKDLKFHDLAMQYCQKALNFEPDFKYVKCDLCQQLSSIQRYE